MQSTIVKAMKDKDRKSIERTRSIDQIYNYNIVKIKEIMNEEDDIIDNKYATKMLLCSSDLYDFYDSMRARNMNVLIYLIENNVKAHQKVARLLKKERARR